MEIICLREGERTGGGVNSAEDRERECGKESKIEARFKRKAVIVGFL